MSNILLLQNTYPFELPEIPGDEKLILNYDKKKADQVWTRPGPPKGWASFKEAKKQKRWIEEESRRCFETGQWAFINGIPYWLPPAFYFTMNWWYMTDGYMGLRMSQLQEEYFELFCEQDPWCIGEFRFKKRRDGLTTRRMARTVWKAIQTRNGWFGIQSKTGSDAKKVCWKILMTGFRRIPVFFLPEMSGNTDPKTMLEFKKPSSRITTGNREDIFGSDIFRDVEEDDDLNTTIDWRDTTDDAYDGQQLNEVNLDEFGKWKKASALDALYTYKRACSLDGIRVGLIHAFTSPPEKNGVGLDDCRELWDIADYTKIKDDETFKIYRWFTSALNSYAGAMDAYGFVDQQKAYEMIMRERNSAPERKRKAIIRQTPMYIDEIFDSIDSDVFNTADEMKARLKYLRSIEYKDGHKDVAA